MIRRWILMTGAGLGLVAALLPAPGALAQHAGLTVTLESIKPTPVAGVPESFQPIANPLQTIVSDPQHGWAQGKPDRDLYKFDIQWGAMEGVGMSRAFTQKRVAVQGHPFNTGLQSDVTEGFNFSALGGLNFTFGRQRTETMDLASVSLGGSQVETMGLTQAYGRGLTAGSLGFSRKVTDTYSAGTDRLMGNTWRLGLRTTEETLSLAQGFGAFSAPGKFEFTRGLTRTEKPAGMPVEQTTDTLKLSNMLWGQTNFTGIYARSHTDQADQAQSQHRGLSFARKFLAGDAAMNWDQVVARAGGSEQRTTVQGFKAPFSYQGTPFAFAFDTSTVQRNGALVSDARKASLTTTFQGSPITAAWSHSVAPQGGDVATSQTASFSLPIAFHKEKIALAFSTSGDQLNGQDVKKQRLASIAIPLTVWRQGASFSFEDRGQQVAGQAFQEARTTKLLMPMSWFGKPVTTDTQYVAVRTPTGETTQLAMKTSAAALPILGRQVAAASEYDVQARPDGGQHVLTVKFDIPFKSGPLSITRRQELDTTLTGPPQQTHIVTIAGPKVPVNARTSLQADMQVTTLPTGVEQHVTHVAVSSTPTPRLTMTADFRRADMGPTDDTTQRSLDTTYALSERLSVNARYLERSMLDRSPFVQRLVVVQQKAAQPGQLSVRAAIADTDDGPNTPGGGSALKLVQIGYGDPKTVAMTLQYQQYDETKLVTLGDPIIKFQLQHGDPKGVHWVFGYEDQQGRPGPYRHYSVGFPARGTALEFGYAENPLDPTDPKGQQVRLASMYDARLSRKILGDMGLDLGYRFCDRPATSTTSGSANQWLQINLSGGKPEGGAGALQFGWTTGDFVPLNTAKPDHTPTSVFSVKYEKTWASDESVSLNVNRVLMPSTAADVKDTYEGRLQFDRKF